MKHISQITGNDLPKVKNIIKELSVPVDSLENGFIEYPIDNITSLESLIVGSPFCFGLRNNYILIGFLVCYEIKKLLSFEPWIIKDSLMNAIIQDYATDRNLYLDVIAITKDYQWKWFAKQLLTLLDDVSQQNNIHTIIAPICVAPHKNNTSIAMLKSQQRILSKNITAANLTFSLYQHSL